MKRPYRTLDAERFAHKWNHSQSVSEVACHCGMSARRCSAMACQLRQRGVVLKHFPSGPARKGKNWVSFDPTLEEIKKGTEAIQKTWTAQNERYHRGKGADDDYWEVPAVSPIRAGRIIRSSELNQE